MAGEALLGGYLLAFCRITILIVFVASVWGKARDVSAFEETIEKFRLLPNVLVRLAAWLFLAGEFAVVILMLLGGPLLLWGFALATGLLVLFTIALVSVLARKISTACNCFGSSQKPVTGFDVWRNGGFISCALLGWGITINRGSQASLQTIEVGLIGIVAIVFVLIWTNLGEVSQVFR